jgi:hypothetical protein
LKKEASRTITLKYLNDVALALDMKFVYGFIPNHKSFEKLVKTKANELAKKKSCLQTITRHLKIKVSAKKILKSS